MTLSGVARTLRPVIKIFSVLTWIQLSPEDTIEVRLHWASFTGEGALRCQLVPQDSDLQLWGSHPEVTGDQTWLVH